MHRPIISRAPDFLIEDMHLEASTNYFSGKESSRHDSATRVGHCTAMFSLERYTVTKSEIRRTRSKNRRPA